MGCVDKQWRSLLADAAVKDVHVSADKHTARAERERKQGVNERREGRKKAQRQEGRKQIKGGKKGKEERENKKRGERVKTGVVLKKVRLIVSAQICWPFQN